VSWMSWGRKRRVVPRAENNKEVGKRGARNINVSNMHHESSVFVLQKSREMSRVLSQEVCWDPEKGLFNLIRCQLGRS
jgi:hypothetical protein